MLVCFIKGFLSVSSVSTASFLNPLFSLTGFSHDLLRNKTSTDPWRVHTTVLNVAAIIRVALVLAWSVVYVYWLHLLVMLDLRAIAGLVMQLTCRILLRDYFELERHVQRRGQVLLVVDQDLVILWSEEATSCGHILLLILSLVAKQVVGRILDSRSLG
jgi:hypothetical protein